MAEVTYNAKKYLQARPQVTRYQFNFDYINKDFVKVYVAGNLVSNQQYSVETREIVFRTPPTGLIVIVRETPTERLVEWEDSSTLLASNMNLEALQLLHITEEIEDKVADIGFTVDYATGQISANGKAIINVKDPTSPSEVMTKKWFDSKKLELDNAMTTLRLNVEQQQQTHTATMTNKQREITRELQDTKNYITSTINTAKASMDTAIANQDATLRDAIATQNRTVSDELRTMKANIDSTIVSQNANLSNTARDLDVSLTAKFNGVAGEIRQEIATEKQEIDTKFREIETTKQEIQANLESEKARIRSLIEEVKALARAPQDAINSAKREMQATLDRINSIATVIEELKRDIDSGNALSRVRTEVAEIKRNYATNTALQGVLNDAKAYTDSNSENYLTKTDASATYTSRTSVEAAFRNLDKYRELYPAMVFATHLLLSATKTTLWKSSVNPPGTTYTWADMLQSGTKYILDDITTTASYDNGLALVKALIAPYCDSVYLKQSAARRVLLSKDEASTTYATQASLSNYLLRSEYTPVSAQDERTINVMKVYGIQQMDGKDHIYTPATWRFRGDTIFSRPITMTAQIAPTQSDNTVATTRFVNDRITERLNSATPTVSFEFNEFNNEGEITNG